MTPSSTPRLAIHVLSAIGLLSGLALAQSGADVPPGPAPPLPGSPPPPPPPPPSLTPAPAASAKPAPSASVPPLSAAPAPSASAVSPAPSASAAVGTPPAPSASGSAASPGKLSPEIDPTWYDTAKQPAPGGQQPNKLSPEIDPAWYDGPKPGTPGAPGMPVPPDRVRAATNLVEKERPLVKRLEAGGFVSGGLDAADGATRFAGFYGRAAWLVAPQVAILGRYAFGSGHVIERFPGSAFGQPSAPNQIEVLESRHAFEAGASYVARLTKGEVRLFAMPYLGPRVALFVNDYAPRWAFEADIALRVGAWAGDDFEASAFFAYDPAIAKAQDVPDVQGTVLTEMRFGASASTRLSGPLGASFGYEGTTINLERGKVSTHALVLGVNYWFR